MSDNPEIKSEDEFTTDVSSENTQLIPNDTKPSSNRAVSTVVTFFVVFAIYFVFSIFFLNILLMPLTVLGYSMHPTLNNSASGLKGDLNTDTVYIEKNSTNIKINDIIVFDASRSGYQDEYFIKRVIATAGDTLQFKATSEATETNHILKFLLYRNDQLVDETSYASETFMEVGYPLRTYIIKSDIYKMIITEQIITVPDNFIFVMGDNRSHSTDSREFGFVESSQVLGKVKIHVENNKNMIFAIIHSIKEDYLF